MADALPERGSEGPGQGSVGRTSPLETILQTAGGYCVARALHAVADLGIADAVDDDGAPIEAVAAATGTHSDTLGRLLRLLSAHGVFDVRGDRVGHNAASRLLRSDHPQSARSLARMFGLPYFWRTFEGFTDTLRTGEPAAGRVYPLGLWDWFGENPEASAVFDEAMRGKSFAQVQGTVAAYDFSPFPRVADIGGGRGHLLAAILEKWPEAQGMLFEQPHVIEQAEGASARMTLVAGDFFRDRLPESDCYVLMEVIHDWDDEPASRILGAVHEAAPAGATLLLVEQLMPDTGEPSWVQMLDIHMLALFAAKQRSEGEYAALLRQAGFRPTRVIEAEGGVAIIEARKD